MIIAIPTKGRAGKVKTTEYFNNCVLFCPISEVDSYKKDFKGKIVGVPVQGITKTRNFILDYAKEKGENKVLMVDDDITFINYFENNKYNKITDKDEILWIVENNFKICEEMGINLWGFSIGGAMYSYFAGHPFSLKSIVLGSFMGIIDTGLRFDEQFTTKEDYDFSLMTLKKDHKTFTDKKHSYKAEHWMTKGGCSSYRSIEKELENQEKLIKKWGNKIVQKQNRRGLHGNKPARFWEVVDRVPYGGI